MPILSDREIAIAVLGWNNSSESAIALRTAIVLAESGGSTTIRNWCCTGLAQIHYVHAGKVPGSPSGKEEFRKWLETPANNMAAAKYVESQQGLDAWEAYTNGSYRKFMGRAGQASQAQRLSPEEAIANEVQDLPVVGAIADPIVALGQVMENFGDVIGRFVSFLTDPNTWKRIVLTIGGVTVAVVGVNIVAKPVTEPALKTARAVALKGK